VPDLRAASRRRPLRPSPGEVPRRGKGGREGAGGSGAVKEKEKKKEREEREEKNLKHCPTHTPSV